MSAHLPEWKHLVPADFSNQSRVWIYQSNRMFLMSEALTIESMLEDFVAHWNSHGTAIKGWANLIYGQFIIIMADETQTGVSGCSTDSSVRLIKEIENLYKVEMFNRLSLAFILKEKVEMLPLQQLEYAFQNGFIQPDTPYFNNLVQTKKDLLENWIIPVQHSWLKSRLGPAIA